MRLLHFLFAGVSLAVFSPALNSAARAGDGPVTLSLDAGLANINATEEVYDAAGRKISHLDWQSKGVTVLRGTLGIAVAPDWQVKAEMKTGVNGNGEMTDYDWLYPYYSDSSKTGWSDRSIHDDTRLDHYYSGSLEINRRLFDDGDQQLSAGLGAKYTDVQWTAYGGSYIYSVYGPRDYSGNFPDGQRGITYRQKIPAVYANLSGSQTFGRWLLTGGLEAGAVIKAEDVDDHWMRDLRFNDQFTISPIFGAKAGVQYQLTQNVSLYLDGSFEMTRFGRGDMNVRHTVTDQSATYKEAGGGSFSSAYVGFGVKGSF